LCASVGLIKKCFDTVDARYKHEVYTTMHSQKNIKLRVIELTTAAHEWR